MTPLETKHVVVFETLVAGGFSPEEASIWAGFTTVALRAVAIAHKRLRRRRAWDALHAAGRAGRPIDEVDISVALYHQIDRLKDWAPLGSPLQTVEFSVELPVDDPNRRGIESRRLDFRIKRRWGNGRTASLAVEAKLLRRLGDVKGAYLGPNGIGCFLTVDSPYTHERVALMFAYSANAKHPPWGGRITTGFAHGPHGAKLHPVAAKFNLTLHSSVPRLALGLEDLSILHAVYEFPPSRPDEGKP